MRGSYQDHLKAANAQLDAFGFDRIEPNEVVLAVDIACGEPPSAAVWLAVLRAASRTSRERLAPVHPLRLELAA